MKNIAIFPFMPEAMTLIKYAKMLNEVCISSLISYQEDMAQLKTVEKEYDISCTISIEDGLQSAEALILLDNTHLCKWDKYYACIDSATKQNKKIYASQPVIEALEAQYGAKVQPFAKPNGFKAAFQSAGKLLAIDTPIIGILGLGENCSKFECQLQCKKSIDAMGYQTISLCSNPLGSMFGMQIYPQFMFDSKISFPQKVILFNQYVNELCDRYHPDLLILGVPSGIIPISECDTNFFSEIPLIVSYALNIDVAIVSFYFQKSIEQNYLQRMMNYCKEKYELPVEAFFMSRQKAEYDGEQMRMQFLYLSDQFIKEHTDLEKWYSYVGHPLNNNDTLYNSLVEILQNNIESV